MNSTVLGLLWSALVTLLGELFLGLLLALLPQLGRAGKRAAEACTQAPLLDVLVAGLTWLPWVAGAVVAGWVGLVGVIVGQVGAVYGWSYLHERAHPQAAAGPRIVKSINRTVGRWRNHAALWVTMIAVPGFWLIRFYEWLVYPWLVWLLGFPRYRHAEWINVSRQKFEGLVGYDLIWCLYCDWMTGVYALGAEMLRNVESFWCPIRFYDGKKCANCRVDFPDIDGGWVAANGTMQQVEHLLESKYGDGQRTWFGHQARLTVRGRPTEVGRAEGGSTR